MRSIVGRNIAAGLLLAAGALACDVAQHSQRARRVEATGVVEAVDAELKQVVIEHGEIEGLMPAMTMSFDVPDHGLLETLAAGQTIDFTIELRKQSFRLVEATVKDEAGSAGSSGTLELAFRRCAIRSPRPISSSPTRTAQLARSRSAWAPAPARLHLHQLSGAVPDAHQRARGPPAHAPTGAGAHARFVSISLDPVRDTPRRCAAYGLRAARTSRAGRSSPAIPRRSPSCWRATG